MNSNTEAEVVKHLSQIVNSQKIAALVVPLIEAVTISRATGGTKVFKASALLASVIEAGSDIYQQILSENGDIKLADIDAVPEKLLLVLSKSLRNHVVLYGSDSLGIICDEIAEVFNDNIGFIQRSSSGRSQPKVQPDTPAPVTGVNVSDSEEIRHHAISAMATVFMPLMTFHTNLYISNFIDEKTLMRLNREAMKYLTEMMNVVVDRVSLSQGDSSMLFGYRNLALCAEMMSSIVHDYHLKLIRTPETLKEYVGSPAIVLQKLEQPIYANFVAMNDAIKKAIVHAANGK